MEDKNVIEHGFQVGSLKLEPLTFWEGVAMIVGTDIGSGVLALAYGARKAGWPVLVFWLIVTAIFTTISMLYTVETTLRTRKPLQVSGLAEKYLGQAGSWLLFSAVAVNSIGCLIAYTTGSGRILSSFLSAYKITPQLGSLLFFIPSTIVVWLGLRATGRAEKALTVCMGLLMVILISASIVNEKFALAKLIERNWYYGIPVFNLTIFSYISQYLVPELTRGFAASGDIKRIPKAIGVGRIFRILSSFLSAYKITPQLGSLLFFIPSTIVVWLGLRATGRAEKALTVCMGLLMVILISASIVNEKFALAKLIERNWYYGIPVFNLTIFSYISQYLVPELTRGFAASGDIKRIPKAIGVGRIFR